MIASNLDKIVCGGGGGDRPGLSIGWYEGQEAGAVPNWNSPRNCWFACCCYIMAYKGKA